jgi:hypothetical protein
MIRYNRDMSNNNEPREIKMTIQEQLNMGLRAIGRQVRFSYNGKIRGGTVHKCFENAVCIQMNAASIDAVIKGKPPVFKTFSYDKIQKCVQ